MRDHQTIETQEQEENQQLLKKIKRYEASQNKETRLKDEKRRKRQMGLKWFMKCSFQSYLLLNMLFLFVNRYTKTYNPSYTILSDVNQKMNVTEAFSAVASS